MTSYGSRAEWHFQDSAMDLNTNQLGFGFPLLDAQTQMCVITRVHH